MHELIARRRAPPQASWPDDLLSKMMLARDGETGEAMTDLLVRDAKLGRALATSLGTRSAALMRHHGAVIVATSIPNVVGRSVYLDLNARVQIQTMSLGGKFTSVDPAEAKLRMTDPNEYARAWELWKRKVSR